MVIDVSLCRGTIEEALAAAPARSLLAVGEDSARLFAAYCERHPATRLVELSGADPAKALGASPPFDLAFVANTLERLPRAEGARLIAGLRDLYATRLYVLVPTGTAWDGQLDSLWSATDLIAYGLKASARYAIDGRPVQLFRHDLYDYKETPDWLNAKHWANPELWDKYRW